MRKGSNMSGNIHVEKEASIRNTFDSCIFWQMISKVVTMYKSCQGTSRTSCKYGLHFLKYVKEKKNIIDIIDGNARQNYMVTNIPLNRIPFIRSRGRYLFRIWHAHRQQFIHNCLPNELAPEEKPCFILTREKESRRKMKLRVFSCSQQNLTQILSLPNPYLPWIQLQGVPRTKHHHSTVS